MYARAAIIGRVNRERNERKSRVIIPAKPQAKPKAAKLLEQLPMSKQCFIPCKKGPWITLLLAGILLSVGAAMCNFAFHADYYSTTIIEESTNNETSTTKNLPLKKGLKSLTYIGPSLMGVGTFLIIVCCVLLFDTREKRLKETVNLRIEQQQEINREYTNRAILVRQNKNKASANFVNLASVTEVIIRCDTERSPLKTRSSEMGIETAGNNRSAQNNYLPLDNQSATDSSDSTQYPCKVEHVTEQINNITTISQPVTPKILMESRKNSSTMDYSHEKWFPILRIAALYNERGPVIEYRPINGVNQGYQHSDYDLKKGDKTISNGNHCSQGSIDESSTNIQKHSKGENDSSDKRVLQNGKHKSNTDQETRL